MPYGINNSGGKPPQEEAFSILDFARQNNIEFLDTADGYGESLRVIGRYHKRTGIRFQVINKFKLDGIKLSEKLGANLNVLGAESLYGYMYHHFGDYESKAVRDELNTLKEKGLIQKRGISIYGVDQLDAVYDDPEIDLIQLPVNLMDLSPRKKDLLATAHASGKEIHARSVYMQGLLLMDPSSLKGNLVQLRPYLEQLIKKIKSEGQDIKAAALNHVLNLDYIDCVVIGVEKVTQLAENLKLINRGMQSSIDAIQVHPDDAFLLNPANWKP